MIKKIRFAEDVSINNFIFRRFEFYHEEVKCLSMVMFF